MSRIVKSVSRGPSNLNYGTSWRRRGQSGLQPAGPGGRAADHQGMNVFAVYGHEITYDSLQTSLTRRMMQWAAIYVRLHVREVDRLAGGQHRDSAGTGT